MKKIVSAVLLAALSLFLFAGTSSAATESPAPSAGATGKSTPGLEMAKAISTITGVAISPLLGVSAVGIWKYFQTPAEKRARLPWYARPWFWVPALLLVLLAFVKDTFGAALPTAAKKPFDIAEAIENKISGLVAAGLFVPLIAAIFSHGDDSALFSGAGLAMIDLTPLLNIITVPFAVIAFLAVWMVSHVIHVLILISPFTTVDAALKGFRLFLLSTVAVTAFTNPYVGAAWSLLIVLISFLLAGWAFRFMVFGSVFTWDFVTLRTARFKVHPERNRVFTACAMQKTPVRTYGTLSRNEQGELVLTYRPWLVFARRTLRLPQGKYGVGRGLFYSEVIQMTAEAAPAILTLPPRYRNHEEEFSSIYMLGGVHDVGLVKGFKAFWSWLKEWFGFGPQPIAECRLPISN